MGYLSQIKFSAQSGTERALLILVALFPLISLSLHSGGSIIYTLLLIIGLFTAWPEWRQVNRAEKGLIAALGIFFLIAALSLLQTVDVANGHERLERIFRIASVSILFLAFRRFRVDAGPLFLIGLLAGVISLTVQAGYEYFYLGKGFINGPTYKIAYGDLAMLTAAILLAAGLTLDAGNREKVILFGGGALALMASLLSGGRGAWLFLPMLPLLLAWCYRDSIKRETVVWGVAALLVLAGVLAISRPAFLFSPVISAINNVEQFIHDPQPYSSVGARLNLWYNSLVIWAENPLFGTGLGDFGHDNRALVASGVSMSSAVEHYGHAHSIYFDALASIGLVGFVAMCLALFVLPMRYFGKMWRSSNDRVLRFHALAGLFTVVAFAVFGLSEGWLSRNPLVNPFIFYLALFAAGVSLRRADVAQGVDERQLASSPT